MFFFNIYTKFNDFVIITNLITISTRCIKLFTTVNRSENSKQNLETTLKTNLLP